MNLFHGPAQRLDRGRNLGHRADDGDARGDAGALQMVRDLIAHHVGLLQNLGRERIGPARGGFVDDDRQRRLDGVGEIADMGARALDDFPVGVDQRVGLARQRRDLDGKFTLQPLGAAGADVGDRFRDAFQRRQAEADLEDRGQQQHDRQREKGAAEIVIEAASLVEDLAGVAGDADQELAVGAEIDRPLHHAQVLPLGAVDIAEADAGRGEFGAVLLELRQLLVPQRARGARFRLFGVGAGDLPVPAGQRQFEQRLAERLERWSGGSSGVATSAIRVRR